MLGGGGGGGRQRHLAALREIKAIAVESDRNKRCIEATPGAVKFLVSVVVQSHAAASTSTSARLDDDLLDSMIDSPMSTSSPKKEALGVLYSLKPSEPTLRRILGKDNGGFLDTLASVLRRPNYRSRVYAVLLLKVMTSAMLPERLGCRPRRRSIRGRTPLRERSLKKHASRTMRRSRLQPPLARSRRMTLPRPSRGSDRRVRFGVEDPVIRHASCGHAVRAARRPAAADARPPACRHRRRRTHGRFGKPATSRAPSRQLIETARLVPPANRQQ
ncbi:Os04g0358300 [Oryza sativa Japonica Group]|uniref:U-box domain-containing protein n=1 Tax=Oryza sativa subsp. japonica TaxID=39947 RepID=A0A0P0W9A5_ORYSJ|nr:Os04g0358300 [Oryza sativa Japonica Group]